MPLSDHSQSSDSTNYSDDIPFPVETLEQFRSTPFFPPTSSNTGTPLNTSIPREPFTALSDTRIPQRNGGTGGTKLSLAAADRKRRLAEATHGPSRRRTNSGGFQTLDDPLSPAGPSNNPQLLPLPSVRSVPQVRPGKYGHNNMDSYTAEQPRRLSASGRNDYSLPPWQADSEVTHCPICGCQFTWYYRKHHCRKCGRVVCANCSPHRITIPRQFIVQPPDQVLPHTPSVTSNVLDLTGNDEASSIDGPGLSRLGVIHFPNPGLGGGEEVRLCNPCVPDPQPNPQQGFSSPGRAGEANRWSTPADFRAGWEALQRQGGYARDNQVPSWLAEQGRTDLRRQRGRGMIFPPENQASNTSMTRQPEIPDTGLPDYGQFGGSILPDSRRRGMPPVYRDSAHEAVPPGYSSSSPTRYGDPMFRNSMPLPDFLPPPMRRLPSHDTTRNSRFPDVVGNRGRVHSMLDVSPSGPSSSIDTSRPPRPRLRERDICPICRQVLPPVGIDGDETPREQHIMQCIAARDPSYAVGSSPPTNTTTITPNQHQQQDASLPSTHPSSPPSRPPILTPTLHLLRFTATEKDCTLEDGSQQECSICMVEYEIGEKLVRLECLCKFHEECIQGWFRRKRECPVHRLEEGRG